MAFLLRLRTIRSFTTPSLSLLHHHRHLSSTSVSGAGDDPSTNHLFHFCLRSIPTLTNPSLSLLHHHHHHRRLFSTSDDPNSNHPSPSLLRELREAVKQISSSLYNCDPTSSTFPAPPSFNSKEEENVPPLEQLKLSLLSLRHSQIIDHKRMWDMDHSRVAFSIEVKENFTEFCRQLEEQPHMQTCESLRNDTHTFITRLTRAKEMTVEVVQVAEVLTKSRLASLQEIIENLSQLRKDLQPEVFDELNEGLMKGKEMELKQFEFEAKEINRQLAPLEKLINGFFEIRRQHG